MSEETVCPLCQTVNLAGTELCIGCGASFASGSATAQVTEGDDDLDSAAGQPTMIEAAVGALAAKPPSVAVATSPERPRSSSPGAPPAAEPTLVGGSARFLARLLLPDGDRRSIEIGDERVGLGSGLDDLGVTGDPRVRPQEAWLEVEGGELYVDPAPEGCGVYRRLRGEETLRNDDVVLMGDIATRFAELPLAEPVEEGVQVLGGGANTPIARIVFLRRDGSDGPVHDLPAGKTTIGRTDGHLNFPADGRLSRRHARFFASGRGVTIEDLGSRNGTYLRVVRRERLEVGDALRIGSAGLQVRSLG